MAITHPRSYSQMIEGSKPGNLRSGEDIPDNGRLPYIVTDYQSPRTSLADIINRYEDNIFLVALKTSLDCQCIVMQT
jgi:hypothetical protein